ncbi:MAG: hypothetical protein Q7S28_03570 [bacterium]|nr:hypothetical protein [bacterium]
MNPKLAVVSTVTVLLVVLTLVFGSYGYPPRGINDGAAYLVPAIQMAETGKLESSMLWTGDHAPHTGPYLAHMPLFPILVNFFVSPGSDTPPPSQAFFFIAIINAIVIVLSAWGLYLIGTMGGRKLDWSASVGICIALFLVLRASSSFGGRDDTLTRLFFTIGFVLALKVKNSTHLAALLGVLLGAMTATSTFAQVFFTALIGFVFAIKREDKASLLSILENADQAHTSDLTHRMNIFSIGSWKSFKYVTITIAVGIAAFVAIMQLSPFSIAETIKGLLNIASVTAEGTVSFQRNTLAIFKSSYVMLYGAIGLVVAFLGMHMFLRAVKAKQVASPLLVILSVATTLFYVAFLVINGFRMYYIATFLLLILAAFLYFITHVQGAKLIKYSTILLFAALVFVSSEHLALFPFFLKDGKTLPVARAEFSAIMAEIPGSRISLGGPRMWALSESYDRMISGDLPPGSGKYIWLQEEEAFPDLSAKPPEYLGTCTLRNDFYTKKVPRLFGFELAPATPGYGFAVFDCDR